ncbi:MAG: two-component system NtrC family sensor kinase [Desulforhopalus sp.]|jgi:two-component system NtrC family sensor kinase
MSFYKEEIHSIRFKLITSLIAVSLFVCLVSILVGGNMLYRSVIDEANNRIKQDLNVARVIYDDRISAIRLALEITASVSEYSKTTSITDSLPATKVINQLAKQLQLDFLGMTNGSGQIIHQYRQDKENTTHKFSKNPLVNSVLETQQTIAGTVVLNVEQLLFENPSLVARADMFTNITPEVQNSLRDSEIAAMTIGVAVPIFVGEKLKGVLYGGFLLNKDTNIVDKIGETVFKNETYKDRNVGTATIFHNDLRIATSVKDSLGKRALGTLSSQEVSQHVLGKGEKWTDRAKVLSDWFITAYEPIIDIFDQRVGMLYVGILEAQYLDIRRKAFTLFAGINLMGLLIAIILGWLFTRRIMRPVTHLIRASTEISGGNFSPDIGPISMDDIGQLQKKFLKMAEALKEKEQRHKDEHETRLLQSEKQASVGKLAAGVAHEINNPLTAVLTFTHLILRRKDLPDEVLKDLEIVKTQTERVRKIVKSLLDFSRQTVIKPESTDINRLIEDCVGLMKNQALIKDVNLSFLGTNNLSTLTLDRNQFQSVLINMIINALDATPSGGFINIETMNADKEEERGVRINISDSGTGISEENLDQLFDPFFTTKEVGKGTGLGLAVTAGIIERHGGTIKVQSQEGEGTTFTIWMPRRVSGGPSDYHTHEKDQGPKS